MAACKDPLLPGEIFHLFNRAVGREKLFMQPGNYDYFLLKVQQYIFPFADLLAYCLLPNHFHLLIHLKDDQKLLALQATRTKGNSAPLPNWLLQQCSNCFNAYTKALNKQQQRTGKLFEEPFRRKMLTTPDYLTRLVAYIHCNPVKHGMAAKVEDWPHSSYHQYLGSESWIQKSEVQSWFGGMDAFTRFHQQLAKDYAQQYKPRRS